MNNRRFRSLRVRIFGAIFLAGLIPCLILRGVFLNRYENRAVSVRSEEVQNQLRIIANHLIVYNYLLDPRNDMVNAELSQLSNLYDGRVLVIGNNLKVVKDTYGLSEGKIIVSEEVVRCVKDGGGTSLYVPDLGYIEILVPITDSTGSGEDNEGGVLGVLLVGISCDAILKTVGIMRNYTDICLIITSTLLLGIALLLSDVMVRPINKVTTAISDVKEGFSDQPMDVPDYVETAHIIEAFNKVLSRMKALDDSRQDFVANVSHELKTPMTAIKILADSLLTQENVPAEIYREFMEDIAAEINRENSIITDLLSMVRTDKSVSEMNVSEISINDLTETILKRLRPIARKKDVEVVFESARQVTAVVDEVKMTMILTNLVDNAIKYNVDHGWVKVLLDADHQYFTITVSDGGIGIPLEAQEHIYERFYRVDKSHSREIGGTGLGLAIVRNAILLHRGTITLHSLPEKGTTFTVRIPLTYLPPAEERAKYRLRKASDVLGEDFFEDKE